MILGGKGGGPGGVDAGCSGSGPALLTQERVWSWVRVQALARWAAGSVRGRSGGRAGRAGFQAHARTREFSSFLRQEGKPAGREKRLLFSTYPNSPRRYYI